MILQPRMCREEVQFGLASSISLGRHIISSAVHMRLNLPVLVSNYTFFGLVAKVNRQALAIGSPTHDTTSSYVYGGGPIWAGQKHLIGPHVVSYLCPHPPELVLVPNFTLFGIVGKGKERLTPLAHLQTIHQPRSREHPIVLPYRISSAVNIRINRC
jgi:hypothetical protein